MVILGAAGRDFHNFNVCFRDRPEYEVVAFTATQIPNIAGRRYPPELAGPLYPEGIPIVPEEELAALLHRQTVDTVIFAYSDVSHQHVMHLASTALAAGADFTLLGPRRTALPAARPVISVGAVRTGAGKSPTTRRVVQILRSAGWRTVILRHPMPYGDLSTQVCQRFASWEDLDRHRCTLEEREEYELHLAQGTVVYAGVDYQRILPAAEQEADVIVWEGGNNDLPFVRPDIHIVVVDPHRPGHERIYHPGEANLRMADVVLISKVNTASPAALQAVRDSIAALNPTAAVVEGSLVIEVDNGEQLRGKRVLVIEDGPTLTHGEMGYGAGTLAARERGAVIVDPRPWAVGSIAEVYARYAQLGPVLPAMGYGQEQLADLAATIAAVPCDVVVCATPVDLRRVLAIARPVVRVLYRLEERPPGTLAELLLPRLAPLRSHSSPVPLAPGDEEEVSG